MSEPVVLQSRVIKTLPVRWRELQFIQQDEFKELPKEARAKLKRSVMENKFADPFKVWEDPNTGFVYCLDGKHRTLIMEELIKDGVMVPDELPATFIDCNNKREAARLVLLYSSIYAKITEQGLFDFLKKYEFNYNEVKMSIDIPEFDTISFQSIYKEEYNGDSIIPKLLQERFIIPPFSVFDTRQGYWQERKKLWNSLFDSQATREDVELVAKSGQAPAVYELRNKMRESLGREPEWDEIIEYARKKGMHIYEGASVFDPVLAEVCYKWFCPDGGFILDPFAGGSVRGIVAKVSGFNYTGIDLRKEQVEENIKQAARLLHGMVPPRWLTGDSLEMEEILPGKQMFDFIFSCPPYNDLEVYSDDPADLSNMDYHKFIETYRSIITKSIARLKQNRFACFVVGDIRDKDGVYRNFVSDTIDCFVKCVDSNGHFIKLYNEIILVNVAGSLPVRVGRQFGNSRKVGKMHQNVLVFYKGDPKKIKEEFPEIKMEEYLQQLNYQPNIGLSFIDD